MALQGATIKPKIVIDPNGTPETVNVGLVTSLNPSASTANVTKKGLGGITKQRLSHHEYTWSWEGILTHYSILKAGLASETTGVPPELEVYMHDLKLKKAFVSSMKISGSEGEEITYSLEGVFAETESVSVPDYPDPGDFYVYSDAQLWFGAQHGSGTETDVNDEVPGGTIDGVNKDFTLANTPIVPSSVAIVVDGKNVVTDDGEGNLNDGGTIDYFSGAISLGIAPSSTLTADYSYYSAETVTGVNGTATQFELTHYPIKPSTVTLTVDGATTVTDDGEGGLSDGGSIDYMTGKITFASAPSTSLAAQYVYYSENAPISSFEITHSREITPVYGVNIDPQDFSIASSENKGSLGLTADVIQKFLLGAWDAAQRAFTFMMKFVNPANPERFVQILGTGAYVNSAKGSVDPDSAYTVDVDFVFSKLSITGA